MRRGQHFPKNQESGQAIVLIALLMVLLLGFTALAIDGGTWFLTKRRENNAVDSVVWTAAVLFCNGNSNWKEAAYNSAADPYGYINDADTTVLLESVFSKDEYRNKVATFRAEITQDLPYNFLQVVYKGPWYARTDAGTKCSIPFTEIANMILWANSHSCQNTINIAQSDVTIEGGILSNNDFHATGSTLALNDVYYRTTYESQATVDDVVHMEEAATMPELYTFADFDYGGQYAQAAAAAGQYHRSYGNTVLTVKPDTIFNGIYVYDNLRINGEITDANIGPDGATFVSRNTLSISVSNIHLSANKYAGGLLFGAWGSGNCGNSVLSISADNALLEGIVVSYNGQATISAAHTIATIAVFAETIDLHGATLRLRYYTGLDEVNPRVVSFTH